MVCQASNTYCRAPGSTQGHAIIENVVEHLAWAAGKDPLQFRMENMIGESGHPIRLITEKLRRDSDYDTRTALAEQFNKEIVMSIAKTRLLCLVAMKIASPSKQRC